MPSQHLLCFVMLKLLSFYSMVIRLQQHCLACTAPLAQLISQTYFMPFALTANAIVARIFTVTSDILPSAERAWSLMTVAVARAPPHSSPPPQSAAVLLTALPALSAPLACVHVAAVQQLRRKFSCSINFTNPSAPDVSTDLPCGFLIGSQDAASKISSNTSSSFSQNSDLVCGASKVFQDDVGIPVGSSKKGMVSKVLRRQKRLSGTESFNFPSPFKDFQNAVGSEFHPAEHVAIRKSSELDIFQESGKVLSAADDIYSALRGCKK
jgi:hypothetical protein